MKEMCRNFVCNNKRCPQAATNSSHTAAAQTAGFNGIIPASSMGDCSSCVMERVGLAQAYVPSQPYTTPMEQEQSLVCGTVFSGLVMPYCSGWNLYRLGREA